MKIIGTILLLLWGNLIWVNAQSDDQEIYGYDEALVWDEDEQVWLDEEVEDDFNSENNWSLSDTLNKQHKTRKFRKDWRENYNGILFDYTETISKKNTSTNNWDLSGLFSFLALLAKIIGYGLIALVVYLVVRALLTDSGISLQSFKKKNASFTVVKDGELNIEEDWHARALDAKNRGDLKSAVRFYFLAYLKQLHQGEYIDFHKDKSNREYRYEINDTAIRSEFDILSRVFDYCWYGEFEINSEQFGRVEILFSKHLKQ